MRLAGLHAVVTGGGTGIGAAIARALAGEGARLTLIGRRPAPLAAVAAELGAVAMPADVTDGAAVVAAFDRARAGHGPITLLINNAGAAASAPFARVSVAEWRAALAVNLDAPFHCCQAALADLLAAPWSRIVTVASTAGRKGYPYVAPYVAAKHGAIGLTRALAVEYARTGLTVNAVCPGFTDTDLVAASVTQIAARTGRTADQAQADLARFNPQGRLVDPVEVADAVRWLCLPTSGAITGQAIAVAGGEVM